MRYTHIPRPVERKAIAAAARSARPLPPAESLLQALVTAHRMRDRHGFVLAAHRAVRSLVGDEEVARR